VSAIRSSCSLAAVDSHTAGTLVSDCLASPLLKDRTVIIVSHHVKLLLPIAQSVIHPVDGAVQAQGTVAELRESGHLGKIVAEETKAVAEKHAEEVEIDLEEKIAQPKVARVARKMIEAEGRGVGNENVSISKRVLSPRIYQLIRTEASCRHS
jgi:ABC-type multidrug transport system ATPase subunit